MTTQTTTELFTKYRPLLEILPGDYAQVRNLLVGVAELTPEGAQAILDDHQSLREDGSVNNRPVLTHNVNGITSSILRDDFPLTGEAIIFDDHMCAIDYQHRCRAVIKANKSIPEILVVIGVKNQAFEYLDQGSKRSIGQMLTLQGYRNGADLASTAISLYLYKSQGAFACSGEAGSQTSRRTAGQEVPEDKVLRSHFRTPSAVREFIDQHPDLIDCVSTLKCMKTASMLLRSRGSFAALMFVLRKVDATLCKAFFETLNAPLTEIVDMDRALLPVCRLRDHLERNRNLSTQETIVKTIKTWNAVYRGRSLQQLRWDADEKYPEIAGITYIKGIPQI